MNNKNEFTQEVEKILREMCNRVGAVFEKIDFKSPNWFLQYEWTEKEENNFKEWLKKQLNKNKKMRKDLMFYSHKSYIVKFINQFCFACGWKIKEKTNE